ncbi:hypothetical protein ABZU32_35805 [Sphaerisporangium sp. NPDC005288]|uniref:hypothetical protein n=1 Tax=Sphaerisporangium sp. NPDC005288 TaxID=3155114 RepID=UPI0033AF0361
MERMTPAADWLETRYQQLQQWTNERYGSSAHRAWIAIGIVIALGVLAVVGAVLAMLAFAISAVVAVLSAVAEGGAALVNGVTDWKVTAVVTEPVRKYITTNAASLGADAGAIWLTWAVCGMVLWVCSLFHSWAARGGWTLFGAATTAMVYMASPPGSQWLAAGVTVMYWAVLSLFALSGLRRHPRTVISVQPSPAPPPPTDDLRENLAEATRRLEQLEAAVNDANRGDWPPPRPRRR